ncbi:MAG: polysaccharide pyruvyl transferase CsaB [Candidatus Melainabacteria bacterium]|nr:MAG: polysaccharide pyruvyl transferase CsaB [Candidatus Melainabacteria bacterium]
MADNSDKKLVLVSGYYGFGNLGDEAILEELTNELKKLISPSQIVVLSNNPQQTKDAFGVEAVDRWKPANLLPLLSRAALFISGGGGLFQDTTGIKSTIFYGCQILMVRALGRKVCVYAQGIGPLKGEAARVLAKLSLQQANFITVRDRDSQKLLEEWNIASLLTADPVWCLEQTDIPGRALDQIAQLKAKPGLTVGLSLRKATNFSDKQLDDLVAVMDRSLALDTKLLLLPLQMEQDIGPLNRFGEQWQAKGRYAEFLHTDEIERPSQWLAILSQLDLLVGMRLHALIMSLSSGVPVVGLAYDPKVRHVLTQFKQPILNLTKDGDGSGTFKEWLPTMQTAVATRQQLAANAREEAESAKKLACQNFELLAKILLHAK